MSYDSRPDTWQHINEVQGNLRQIAIELTRRGLKHDQSKLETPEVEIFDRVTPLLKELEYGTDEYKASLKDMGPALQHHYAVNDHHPEHFANGVYDMNLIQLIEMLADWKAATMRTKNGDLQKSIIDNAERFDYDEKLNILLTTANALGWIQ